MRKIQWLSNCLCLLLIYRQPGRKNVLRMETILTAELDWFTLQIYNYYPFQSIFHVVASSPYIITALILKSNFPPIFSIFGCFRPVIAIFLFLLPTLRNRRPRCHLPCLLHFTVHLSVGHQLIAVWRARWYLNISMYFLNIFYILSHWYSHPQINITAIQQKLVCRNERKILSYNILHGQLYPPVIHCLGERNGFL